LAGLIYGLYLLGLVNGLTILIGLAMAYLSLRGAGPMLKSHHVLQIRTVWIAVFWFVVGGGLIYGSIALRSGMLAAPLGLLGWLVCGSTWLWFAARSVAGLLYLLRAQPYPRPRSWLI
jgi:uncharacterized membrane protein